VTTQLKDVRILLSGASRGVGYATARVLIEEGAQVLGIARDERRLAEASLKLAEIRPGTFTRLCVDLANTDAPAQVASYVEGLWGALDIAIHNAGVMLHRAGGLMDEPEGILESSLDINLLAPFRLSRALLPLLRKGNEPRIINVGSGAGTMHGLTEPGIASYRLSKWALNGLTMLQAKDLAEVVSVNAFDPGWVRTDLGGPEAPGSAEEAADGLRNTLLLPWSKTGLFYKDAQEIPW
jgi:NAD(P)-dependent dehydrogenase (short-subunit alcohol dehydrogenase family)